MRTDLQRFFDRSTTWKATLVVLAYLVFYLGVGQVIGATVSGLDGDDPLHSPRTLFFSLILPIGIGAIALLSFATWMGWTRELFARQSIGGARWMWIGPLLIVAAIALHVVDTDFGRYSADVLALMALVGLCVGVAEELITRGIAIKLLRDAGHGERFVAVVSSLLFASMHLANFLGGMSAQVVGVTVVYTFGFGMCMYFGMRVTGFLVVTIVLHGFTDPTTFLDSGGIDEAVNGHRFEWASSAASLVTIAYVVFGFVAIAFIRGRVGTHAERGLTVPAVADRTA